MSRNCNNNPNHLNDDKIDQLFLRKNYTVVRMIRLGNLPDAFVDISPARWEFSIEKGSVETGVFVHGVLVW
jgi:hypothetical protein